MSKPAKPAPAEPTLSDRIRALDVEAERLRGLPPGLAERSYRGCVMVREGASWRWAEVSLPESVVQAHTVRTHTPDMKAMVVGQIENVFLSEAMVTGRGWDVKR